MARKKKKTAITKLKNKLKSRLWRIIIFLFAGIVGYQIPYFADPIDQSIKFAWQYVQKNIFNELGLGKLFSSVQAKTTTISTNKNHTKEQINCRVTKVSDGDTLICVTGQQKYKVRLYQIDAPESEQSYGDKSAKALRNFVLNKNVQLKVTGTDQYHRTLATVFLKNQDINLEMVKQGHAWVYRQYAKDASYFSAQEEAQKKRLGLWKEKNPQEPRLYRKAHR